MEAVGSPNAPTGTHMSEKSATRSDEETGAPPATPRIRGDVRLQKQLSLLYQIPLDFRSVARRLVDYPEAIHFDDLSANRRSGP